MAKQSSDYPGDWGFNEGGDIIAYFKKQDAQIDAIYAAQPEPDGLTLVGACLRFLRGDGFALYVVVKDRPLTVSRVPFGDNRSADECTIRGINAEYVRQELVRQKAMKSLMRTMR
jgi:hypothetical protein